MALGTAYRHRGDVGVPTQKDCESSQEAIDMTVAPRAKLPLAIRIAIFLICAIALPIILLKKAVKRWRK